MLETQFFNRRYIRSLISLLIFNSLLIPAVNSQDKVTHLSGTPKKAKPLVIRYSGNSIAYNMIVELGRDYSKKENIDLEGSAISDKGAINELRTGKKNLAIIANPERAGIRQNEFDVTAFAADGISVCYNVSGSSVPLRFTGYLLADIFSGRVKRWDDVRIKRLNRAANLPKASIQVLRPDAPLFVTYAGTTYLSQISPQWKQQVGSGYQVRWPVGRDSKRINGEGVLNVPNSIELVSTITAKLMNIPQARLQNRSGNFVLPSHTGISEALESSLTVSLFKPPYVLMNASGKNAYPLVYNLYLVTKKRPKQSDTDSSKFVRWISEQGRISIKKSGFVPVSEK